MAKTETNRPDYHDEETMLRVSSFLKSRHFESFGIIEVKVENGVVTLSGNVGSYYEKQVAISSVLRVAGVANVVDEITVNGELSPFGKTQRSLVKEISLFVDPGNAPATLITELLIELSALSVSLGGTPLQISGDEIVDIALSPEAVQLSLIHI